MGGGGGTEWLFKTGAAVLEGPLRLLTTEATGLEVPEKLLTTGATYLDGPGRLFTRETVLENKRNRPGGASEAVKNRNQEGW